MRTLASIAVLLFLTTLLNSVNTQRLSVRGGAPIDQPPYEVLRGYLSFDVRQYLPSKWAAVTVGPFANVSTGLQSVKSYFDGGNEQQVRLARTMPSVISLLMPGAFEVWQYMPFAYQKVQAPTPLQSSGVYMKQEPITVFAATYYFSSDTSPEKLEYLANLFRAILLDAVTDEYIVGPGYLYANYDIVGQIAEIWIPLLPK
jgi:hypothetical protein